MGILLKLNHGSLPQKSLVLSGPFILGARTLFSAGKPIQSTIRSSHSSAFHRSERQLMSGKLQEALIKWRRAHDTRLKSRRDEMFIERCVDSNSKLL